MAKDSLQYKKNALQFSSRLNDLLNSHGKKQIDLHRDLGIPKSTITGYVKGTSLPNHDNAQKLANYFGIPIGELDPRFNSTPTPPAKTADLSEDDVLFTYQGKPLSAEDKALIRRLMNGKE